MHAFIRGVSLWGPGLEGWQASRSILSGGAVYVARDLPPPASQLLSATERRRTGLSVRLALAVAQQASEQAGIVPGAIRSIFATSNGDGAVLHAILDTLAGPDPLVSPTQFHNSVHNAAAGYWTIINKSVQPATCLGCHDASLAAALLKAVAEAQIEQEPVLLCVYDTPFAPPLSAKRHCTATFGVGFVLAPDHDGTAVARIKMEFDPATAVVSLPRAAGLADLVAANPAAQSLPLLEALARAEAARCDLPLLDGRVSVSLTPCSTGSASRP
jgi:Beta-ketoacyl synthase, N-terminal domain